MIYGNARRMLMLDQETVLPVIPAQAGIQLALWLGRVGSGLRSRCSQWALISSRVTTIGGRFAFYF